MGDRHAAIGCPEPPELIPDLGLVSDQDHVNVELVDRLERAFDVRGRPEVSAHRIYRDFHVLRETTTQGLEELHHPGQDSSTAITALPL
jgi:hypothetical protein